MGGTVEVIGLTKSFGNHNVWRDVTFSLPPGEITALLGPSGTGKSVLLKSVMGLLRPEQGQCLIDGVDMVTAPEEERAELRKRFGVLFQDGALFGSMSVYDNVAFPLREHTNKTEAEIRSIVNENLDRVGLMGEEHKLPGQVSGGMRKRAGLARSLVRDPDVILFDEPDSGLDPIRTAYLAELIMDVNAATDATMLVVTHNIDLANTLPDNLGMLYRGQLVAFGPRELVLTADEPVINQFLTGSSHGPIAMSEEGDATEFAGPGANSGGAVMLLDKTLPEQLTSDPSLGIRQGAVRHAERLKSIPAEELLLRGDPTPKAPLPLEPAKPAIVRGLRLVGDLFALGLETVRLAVRRPFALRELIEQFWFLARVSILPAILVAIPFGAVIALQLGTLTVQIGAQSFTGAASVLAVVQQASPIVTALVIAGAGGAAICADLGSRTIREEIDAMEVLGVSPIQRLIVPRVIAAVLVAILLNGIVSVVGVAGGYFFNVIVQGGTPGAYLASFTALAQIQDLWVGEIKAAVFGFIAGLVAAHRGLNPAGGPKGVGDAVNQSVVVTFLMLFFVNFVITTLYLQIVPAKGA